VAANGISTLEYKRARQEAKLALASANRAASGRRENVDLTQLPTLYAEGDNNTNNVVDNANADGIVTGRPWTNVTIELFTPEELTTKALWLDAADASTITSSSGLVSQWADKSGNGNNSVQPTGSMQAETSVNTLNGLNLITSRGGQKFMTVTNAPTAIMVMAVIVMRSTSTGTILSLGSNSGTSPNYEVFLRAGGGTDISFDGQGTGEGKYSINAASFSGFAPNFTEGISANSYMFSGVLDAAQPIGAIIGRDGLGSDASGHDVGEIIWLSPELSTTNRQKTEGYLAWKWGLESNLPAGHPYKNAAPTV
tara:strand:- start:1281 stop:2210 length:930 start_codon:yes stop_codon:yes gene_type:complete